MSYIMVDVEADGPIPGDYSMIEIGAVVVEEPIKKKFHAKLHPISEKFNIEALSISGYAREETLKFEDPERVMKGFYDWIKENSNGRPIFVSDNNGFDWMFVCWYFHHFIKENPFGYSSMNLGSFYKGVIKDVSRNFKHLRKTKHTHNSLDDATGNAEAMLAIIKENNVNIRL